MDREMRPEEKREVDGLENYRRKYLLTCKWKGSVDEKLNKAAPFFFFLTRVEELSDTYDEDLSLTFPELLDASLGHLVDSLHVNFMVELPWLLAQYAVNDLINPTMTILYDSDTGGDLRRAYRRLNLTAVQVKSPYPYGHHHTKMSIFFYKDKSIRFAVYTANLIESDWEDRTQGVWISPKCPYLGDGVPVNYGESETLFKVEMMQYLRSYRLPELREWLRRIQQSDCSSIRVCLLTSVPGNHRNSWGHRKLGKLIEEHSLEEDTSGWRLIAQCSSIGSLGQNPYSWLLGEFANSLSGSSNCPISVIYPSVENVSRSLYGMFGGSCLPYSSETHKKQTWLNRYLKQWKSDGRHRSRAVPHIKTYAKMSSTGKEIAWFLLTSANLSKAAWGKSSSKSGLLQILSYEAGVVFFPKFLVGKKVFTVGPGIRADPAFPLPYDFPLTPYGPTDQVFLFDKHYPRD